MKNFHVIAGLPRSGSTLLCNILNQNPAFHASSTGVISPIIWNISNIWSNSPEYKSYLISDKNKTDKRTLNSVRKFIEGWYDCEEKEVIFDKDRTWSNNTLVFEQLFPKGKMFVMVRDLRSILASFEKQHQKNPILDASGTPFEKTLAGRTNQLFADNGLIGSCLIGINDLINRNRSSVKFIKYEDFVKDPERVLDLIYNSIQQKRFHHDFNNIENTSINVDGLYLNKFPHQGEGKLEDRGGEEHKYISNNIQNEIMSKFSFYNSRFGYF